jgi:hypothetical protein
MLMALGWLSTMPTTQQKKKIQGMLLVLLFVPIQMQSIAVGDVGGVRPAVLDCIDCTYHISRGTTESSQKNVTQDDAVHLSLSVFRPSPLADMLGGLLNILDACSRRGRQQQHEPKEKVEAGSLEAKSWGDASSCHTLAAEGARPPNKNY